jgi:prepilin-type N-terminal cleavage/methylation domain-containing protein
MRPPRAVSAGFTLLEVLLAVTLTAVAATVAGAALQAARQASSRVSEFRESTEPAQQLHDALNDLLRHAPPAERVEEALFALRPGPTSDTLVFLSRGVQQPFGTGAAWRVQLFSDSIGLHLRAQQLGAFAGESAASFNAESPSAESPTAEAQMEWLVPGATDFSVAVASFEGVNLAWRSDWPLARARPAAVRLSWRSARGQTVEQLVSLLPLAEGTP